MKGSNTTETVAIGLDRITFPQISRPRIAPGAPRTEELIRWGTNVYVYSMLAHVRKVLSGLLEVARTENVPVANVISRHLFECSAHVCYVCRRLTDCYESQDWNDAWDVLTPAATGNLWAKKYGDKYATAGSEPTPPAADPVRIGVAISEYEQYQSKALGRAEAKDTYSLLSELSHPNAACLQQYLEYENDGQVTIGYTESPSPLPFVNLCLIDLLQFAEKLLRWSRDLSVRPVILELMSEIARRAPKAGHSPARLNCDKLRSNQP